MAEPKPEPGSQQPGLGHEERHGMTMSVSKEVHQTKASVQEAHQAEPEPGHGIFDGEEPEPQPEALEEEASPEKEPLAEEEPSAEPESNEDDVHHAFESHVAHEHPVPIEANVPTDEKDHQLASSLDKHAPRQNIPRQPKQLDDFHYESGSDEADPHLELEHAHLNEDDNGTVELPTNHEDKAHEEHEQKAHEDHEHKAHEDHHHHEHDDHESHHGHGDHEEGMHGVMDGIAKVDSPTDLKHLIQNIRLRLAKLKTKGQAAHPTHNLTATPHIPVGHPQANGTAVGRSGHSNHDHSISNPFYHMDTMILMAAGGFMIILGLAIRSMFNYFTNIRLQRERYHHGLRQVASHVHVVTSLSTDPNKTFAADTPALKRAHPPNRGSEFQETAFIGGSPLMPRRDNAVVPASPISPKNNNISPELAQMRAQLEARRLSRLQTFFANQDR